MFMIRWIVANAKIDDYLTKIDVIAMFLAAIAHDLNHPGMNNHYEIKTKSKISQIYGEKSTLEK